MLRLLKKGASSPQVDEPGADFRLGENVIWIDLFNPSRSEELAAEKALGLSLPTREEMAEIESSSRLYREDGALFMTASLLAHTDTLAPKIGPVTFVLCGARLVTIRYIEPKAFGMLCANIEKHPTDWHGGADVFFGLLDPVIDRLADTLEHAVTEVDALSANIFRNPNRIDHRRVMKQLGRSQDINVKIRESAASLMRLLIFAAGSEPLSSHPEERERVAALERDLASVIDYSGHLSANITFLLDSALGLINVEQNGTMKVLSVATVIFLPPTLIASYFGMNFKDMPALDWPGGEFIALGMMIASMLGTLFWMRRKGWL